MRVVDRVLSTSSDPAAAVPAAVADSPSRWARRWAADGANFEFADEGARGGAQDGGTGFADFFGLYMGL